MAVTGSKPGPYTAPSAVVELINRYRNRGLPAPIDKEVLARASVADGLIGRTIQSLQTLDLIDDKGMPTKTFEMLRLAPGAEFKARMEEWLRSTYAEVFSYVDPSKDDEVRVRDAFRRSYGPVGQQSRMVALFLGLCAAAGLIAEKPEISAAPCCTRGGHGAPPILRISLPDAQRQNDPRIRRGTPIACQSRWLVF